MRFSNPTHRRAPELGTLELQVLHKLWSAGTAVDARSLREVLVGRRLSLSTVQATLERLHRKGLLTRTKISRAYFYSAAVSRESVIGALIRDVTDRLADGALEPVISGFVDFVYDKDPGLLDQVEARVAKVRGTRGK